MRLFEPPPSLLLSNRQKKHRDRVLQGKLRKLKDELASFETQHLRRGGEGEGGGVGIGRDQTSLTNAMASHGRMMSDLREMESVVERRCQSRWAPGLGRRRNNNLPTMMDNFKPVLAPMEESLGHEFSGAGGMIAL